MKYYFVENVHKPDPGIDSKESNKSTKATQSKKALNTKKTNKGTKHDTTPVLKMRIIRTGPLRKVKAPPREPQRPTRRNRRTKDTQVAVMPQRMALRAGLPHNPQIRRSNSKSSNLANSGRNIAKTRRQR